MSICCDVQHPIPSANHARYECLRVKRPTRRGDQNHQLITPRSHCEFLCLQEFLGDTHAHSSSLPHLCGDEPPQTVRWSRSVQGQCSAVIARSKRERLLEQCLQGIG